MSQTHTPRAKATIRKTMNNSSDSSGASSQYSGKAAKVPNVPGALRARPLPKPKEIKCAGWLNKSRQPGLTSNSSEMVIAAASQVDWIARRIVRNTALPGNNISYTRQRQIEFFRDAQHITMTRG